MSKKFNINNAYHNYVFWEESKGITHWLGFYDPVNDIIKIKTDDEQIIREFNESENKTLVLIVEKISKAKFPKDCIINTGMCFHAYWSEK